VIHLDTSFVIDALREASRRRAGPATAFLEALRGEEVWVSVHAVCELLAGAEISRDPPRERSKVERFLAGVEVAYPDSRFALTYGRLLAWLQGRGQGISPMDLLIATAAVVEGAPLVTGNREEFSRVPGLQVLGY
jgi:predicted nucleic acid-binding protein